MKRHRIAFAAVALAGAALDLATKQVVFASVRVGEQVVVVDGFFEIGCAFNRGIAFGTFPEAGRLFVWITLLAVPAIVAIFASLKRPRWVMTASLALILGGTIGNLSDRVFIGAVRDFILFHLPTFRTWPPAMAPWHLFNIADSCICVGVTLLSLEMFFFDERKKKPPAPETAVPQGPTEPMSTAGAPPVPQGPTKAVPHADPPTGP